MTEKKSSGATHRDELDAAFPDLPPLPKLPEFGPYRAGVREAVDFTRATEARRPEFMPWEVDLAQFGDVPVSTVLRTLEILGLKLEPTKVGRS